MCCDREERVTDQRSPSELVNSVKCTWTRESDSACGSLEPEAWSLPPGLLGSYSHRCAGFAI